MFGLENISLLLVNEMPLDLLISTCYNGNIQPDLLHRVK